MDLSEIVRWLIDDAAEERNVSVILVELCERLVFSGVPLARATLFFDGHNPEWLGARIIWKSEVETADLQTYDYGIDKRATYLNSPMHLIDEGAPFVRQRLSDGSYDNGFPIYDELRSEGMTDYVAWPLRHTLGHRHAITFATAHADGFSSDQIEGLRRILPALAIVSEIRLKNRLTRTILETYVGPHASKQVIAGATTRGTGFTVRAAIMIGDLRDFTAISDARPRDDVLRLLNGFFDAMGDPIAKYGGEILKFMGDGFLAIFELKHPSAPVDLLKAVAEGRRNVDALNDSLGADGIPPIAYGIGIHVGDVTYGNIGSRNRLDFTAIGPAVNIASRLEGLTKTLQRPVLLSREFVDLASCQSSAEPLGLFQLKGLGRPVDVFAFHAESLTVDPAQPLP